MPVAGLFGRRVPTRRLVISLLLTVLLGLVSLSNAPAARAASPCGPPVTSVIACENTLPGDPPSDWQVSGAGDSTIQGFATSMSVNAGQTESFKINTPAKAYHIDILRIGYYQGDGARKVVSDMLPTATLPQTQPACINDTQPTGLVDCGNWAVSASWAVPPPLQELRNRPMTRASTINRAFFSVGLSKRISKSWHRSKVTVANDSLHGFAPAAATPVMVTLTVSGDGWATSMLPAPVWPWPHQDGTEWPCRSPSWMLAGGGGWGAGATGFVSGGHGATPS